MHPTSRSRGVRRIVVWPGPASPEGRCRGRRGDESPHLSDSDPPMSQDGSTLKIWPARHGGRDGLNDRQYRTRDRLLLRIRSNCSDRRCCCPTDDPGRRRSRCSPGVHCGRVHQSGALGWEFHHLCRDWSRTEGRCRHGPLGDGRLHRCHGGGVHHVGRDGGSYHRPLHVVECRLGATNSRTHCRCHLADHAWCQALDGSGRRCRAYTGDRNARCLPDRPG